MRKQKLQCVLAASALAGLGLLGSHNRLFAQAIPIPISNNSFQTTVSPGDTSSDSGGQPTEWSFYVPNSNGNSQLQSEGTTPADPSQFSLNGDGTYPAPASGTQGAYVNIFDDRGPSLAQVIYTPDSNGASLGYYVAGATYTLTYAGGFRASSSGPGGQALDSITYTASFISGTGSGSSGLTPLATGNPVSYSSSTDGTFQAVSVSFVAPASIAGQPIGIDLQGAFNGSVGAPSPFYITQTIYSNVQLTETPPPAVSSDWLPAGSGDFNNASNWSLSMVPNSIGSTANFGPTFNTGSQTVYSNIAITVGMINFFNANGSYYLSGAGPLTLQQSNGNSAGINVLSGSHVIQIPVIAASNTTFNVASGSALTLTGPLSVNAGKSVNQSGGGVVNYQDVITLGLGASITFANGGNVPALTLSPGASARDSRGSTPKLLAIRSLSISGSMGNWTSLLDLSNNALAVSNESIAAVMNQLKQGFHNGTWQGSGGITSSAAAADSSHLTALGALINDTGANTGVSTGTALKVTLEGSPVSDGQVLVKYTYYGDANLDGKVDGSDYSLIDNANLNRLTGWYNGDFNYDGIVNGSDYTLIDNAFNSQGAQLSAEVATPTASIGTSAVPEPGSLALLGLMSAGVLGKRHRRCQ